MEKASHVGEVGVPRPTFPNPATTLVGFVVAASLISGCGSESDRAFDETMSPAAAGVVGALGGDSLGQDPTPMVVRRVWGGPDVNPGGEVSPDGRHLVFTDGEGNLAVREISTGETRRLTEDASWVSQWAETAAVSPDGQQVAYSWYQIWQTDPYELRIVGWDGSGPRVLSTSESCLWVGVDAWSPDGQRILISCIGADESFRLALVSVADGSLRTLREFGRLGPAGISLSPDGRYVLYDRPAMRNPEERDIFALDVDSGEETPMEQHLANDFALGWAPDGRHILFASDRSGALGAWLRQVEDGRPVEDARMVKADLWRVNPIGFSVDGSFFFRIPMESEKVFVATLDPETGAVLVPPIPVSGDRLALEDCPRWSPDGRFLAYRTLEGQQAGWHTGEYTVSIRSVETGETRQLRLPDLESIWGSFLWFPDGHHLLAGGSDKNGREGVFKVDVQTGEAEALPAFWDLNIAALIDWSSDARSVFYRARLGDGSGSRVTVTDLESGEHQVVYDQEANRVALSPDGSSFAFAVGGGGERSIMVMPAMGGAPRELHRFPTENDYNVFAITWSSDGQHVLYVRPWGGTSELWRVPVGGGSAEKLDLPGIWTGIRFHPDGRRVAYETRQSGGEVWVMENFLPQSSIAGISR